MNEQVNLNNVPKIVQDLVAQNTPKTLQTEGSNSIFETTLKVVEEFKLDKNDSTNFKKEILPAEPDAEKHAKAYAEGEKVINGGYSTLLTDPPKYQDEDGKIYSDKDELLNARRDRYEKEHPEYAEARGKCEEALDDYNSFMEEEMAKWDKENGYTPQNGTLLSRSIDEDREAYMKTLQDAYRQTNPYYDAVCEEMDLEYGPKVILY